MDNELETRDASVPEGDQDTTPENESSEELTKAQEYGKNQKVRAEKAESENKTLKAELAKFKTSKETETPQQTESNESDYQVRIDKLSLKAEGITNQDDQKIVLDEAKRLKLSVEEVVQMEHIKNKLKDSKDQREAQDGMPKSKGKAGSATTQDIDYYLAKGTTPDDLELAEKVINARMKREQNANKFSETLYTG